MARPEPMNATPHHSKVKVSLSFSEPLFVAGENVTGKMELECRAERGLGINVIKVELFAIQDLTSRDHSATSTFLHLTRYFQGAGLPPSNAVFLDPLPESDPLPADHYPARKGTTTFFFRFPLPRSSPASINFCNGLARLKYEVRASVGISWRGERRYVMERRDITVAEALGRPTNPSGDEQIVVGENGKIWMQGRILNPYVVAGHNACVELFVRNHSMKSASGLDLTLMRRLHLPIAAQIDNAPQISDTLLSMPFRGEDYVVHPGTEGIANLVFSVPNNAFGVRAGRLDTGEGDYGPRRMDSLFFVQCSIQIELGGGFGGKKVILELPVTVVHPAAMKIYSTPEQFAVLPTPLVPAISPPPFSPWLYATQATFEELSPNYMSPPISPFPSHPLSPRPLPPAQPAHEQYYYNPPPPVIARAYPARPSSADPLATQQLPNLPGQTYQVASEPHINPVVFADQQQFDDISAAAEGEPGKGQRASRIAAHLRTTSRHRSVSPQSHRFPEAPVAATTATGSPLFISQSNQIAKLSTDFANDINTIDRGLDAVPGLLSPRPILGHKHSFSVDNGTVKSERVVDLERMAAKEAAGTEKDKDRDKTLPRRPSNSEDRVPDTPTLPREPILMPLNSRPKSSLQNRAGGLEALERKLLEQVGTRKPEPERRVDVRSVLPNPITIPPSSDPRIIDPNDSAISSLALGAAGGPLEWSPPTTEVAEKLPPSQPESYLQDGGKSNGRAPREKVKERDKRTEVHQLRKAATGRIAAWLGGIDPAAPPMLSESVVMSSPKTPVEETALPVDPDHHPLPHLPSVTSSVAAHDVPADDAIPTRSSGFVLHATTDLSNSLEQVYADHIDRPQTVRPTQPNSSLELSTPNHTNISPVKPVLQRFAGLSVNPQPSGVKYDVRSARGGRGGKVTSVAALWASLTSQQDTSVHTPRLYEKAEAPGPAFGKPQLPPLPDRTSVPSKSPPHVRKSPEVTLNATDLTNRRAKMSKASSIPAVLSSSHAIPVLSSTASLARPIQASHPKYLHPRASANTASMELPPSNAPRVVSHAPKSPPRDPAFGQAKLKDLIKKYQQGFEQ
ncbi:hypothetical protein M0805_008385 [Coniferiporia weirii]|nr:hypothetical protein M0805_008385 [Coniferiporia weirii]